MPMPAPVGAYVVGAVAVVGVVAAGVAFKEFVYEPHLAPWIEQMAESFLERRRAGRQRNCQTANPISSRARRGAENDDDSDDDNDNSLGSLGQSARTSSSQMQQSLDMMEMRQLFDLKRRSSDLNASTNNSNASLRNRNRNRSGITEQRQYLIDESSKPPVLRRPNKLTSSSTPQSFPFAIGDATPANDAEPLPSTVRAQTFTVMQLPSPDTSAVASSPFPPKISQRRPLTRDSPPRLSEAFPVELGQEQDDLLSRAFSSDSPLSGFPRSLPTGDGGVGSGATTDTGATNFLSFSSASEGVMNTGSAGFGFVSPTRTLSDLDFLSDAGEHGVRSPFSVTTDITGLFDEDEDDDRSIGTESSWESAR